MKESDVIVSQNVVEEFQVTDVIGMTVNKAVKVLSKNGFAVYVGNDNGQPKPELVGNNIVSISTVKTRVTGILPRR